MDEKILATIEVMAYELMKKGVFHAEVENAVDRAVERYRYHKTLVEILEESGKSLSDSEMENIIDDAQKLKLVTWYTSREEALKEALDRKALCDSVTKKGENEYD